MAGKHIVLITTGQPSTNPRLVKEADTLQANGFQVTVLYAYWNLWATEADLDLLNNRNWKAIRVGGDPKNELFNYFLSRLCHYICRKLFINLGYFPMFRFIYPSWIVEGAISRATFPLIKSARKFKADLYLAHNLGALPAAVHAAKANCGLAGFDAEDYHRFEVTDREEHHSYKLCKTIEDQIIPQLDYFTVSSPMIKALYDLHYKTSSTEIRNVFPSYAKKIIPENNAHERRIKLCWFSQCIGPNRGLELIIAALYTLPPNSFEFHLIGALKPGFENILMQQSSENWMYMHVTIHPPIGPDQLFDHISTFDIGIASEPAFCTNNNAALSNKIFSYLSCGLALLLSDTAAQLAFLQAYPGIGKSYNKYAIADCSQAIRYYIDHPEYLENIKKHNYHLGQQVFNWEREQKKFLTQVFQVMDRNTETPSSPGDIKIKINH